MKWRRYKKAYKEGYDGAGTLKWTDNPYKEGSMKWISWNDGRGDKYEEGDEEFVAEWNKRMGIK